MAISFLTLLFSLIDWLITLWQGAIIIRCILSWVPHSPYHPFIKIIYQVTEPILKPFRMIKLGMVDFSPVFALLAISLLRSYVLLPLFNVIARTFS